MSPRTCSDTSLECSFTQAESQTQAGGGLLRYMRRRGEEVDAVQEQALKRLKSSADLGDDGPGVSSVVDQTPSVLEQLERPKDDDEMTQSSLPPSTPDQQPPVFALRPALSRAIDLSPDVAADNVPLAPPAQVPAAATPGNDDGAHASELDAFLQGLDDLNVQDMAKGLDSHVLEDPALLELQSLEKDIEAGVSCHGALGAAFGRAANGGQHADYRRLKSHDEKRAFRTQWARAKLETMKQTKFKKVALTKKHLEVGEYLSPDLIVDREGGEAMQAAKTAAANYIRKCVAMGGKWCVKKPHDREDGVLVHQTWLPRDFPV